MRSWGLDLRRPAGLVLLKKNKVQIDMKWNTDMICGKNYFLFIKPARIVL